MKDKFESIEAALTEIKVIACDEAKDIAVRQFATAGKFEWLMKIADTALTTLQDLEKEMAGDNMKKMGMLSVLCESHLFLPEDEQDMVRDAVTDNLPEGWTAKRTLQRLELMPPQD